MIVEPLVPAESGLARYAIAEDTSSTLTNRSIKDEVLIFLKKSDSACSTLVLLYQQDYSETPERLLS